MYPTDSGPTGISRVDDPQGGTVVALPGVRAVPLSVLMAEERRAAEQKQSEPVVTGVAAHVRRCWDAAKQAKRTQVDQRLVAAQYARRGEYTPSKLESIKAQGGSEVFARVVSVKCRAASAWLRDVLTVTGDSRPWSLRPTPIPDLPVSVNEMITTGVALAVEEAQQAGQQMTDDQIKGTMSRVRDRVMSDMKNTARHQAERMATKMEDQLLEGGLVQAMSDFIDDLTTYPAAIIKGPVIRKVPTLTWDRSGPEPVAVVQDTLRLHWERVSPFDIYPSPQSTGINDGYLIEKHRLSRLDLTQLIGVEGYDDGAIQLVLEAYGRGGLTDWTANTQQEQEQRDTTALWQNSEGLIDALQYWGCVRGQDLLDWGLTEEEVPEPTKEYHVEAWVIGNYVIKASINADPLYRKPYYKASYETVPGSFWGNGVADLVADSADIINACARAIVNNMGIASGPQVVVNVDRLAVGEDITNVVPWKIWQVNTDPYGSTAAVPPISFFQPNANVQELMALYEKFSQLADEYSGIPRYLTGDTTGGAGRTASGLSMLINNAGKSIKQVIATVDNSVLTPLLERLYYYNMVYSDDPDLKGDVQIIASGSTALIAKETAMMRRNEFLAATANPVDMQVVGVDGRAAILREVVKGLDMDSDKVVPSEETMLKRAMMAAQQQAAQAAQAQAAVAGQQQAAPSPGETLQDGTPTTDNFSPT